MHFRIFINITAVSWIGDGFHVVIDVTSMWFYNVSFVILITLAKYDDRIFSSREEDRSSLVFFFFDSFGAGLVGG